MKWLWREDEFKKTLFLKLKNYLSLGTGNEAKVAGGLHR